MPTLNWCYGAKSPDIEQAVSDAIFAAHKYRNRLCELELEKRKRHYDILRRIAPAFVNAEELVAATESELGSVRESIQAERVKQRTKTPAGVSQLMQKATELKELLKARRAELKETKLAAYSLASVKAAIDQNTSQHRDDCKKAKSDSGLYWGTEAIISAACRSFASGAPPRFKRFEGEGQLAVQLQGGLDCADAGRYNTLCHFGESIGKRRECFIRIGSSEGKPVFAKVLVAFHRPLPEGKIKWAYLERRKIADHVRWTIRLTVDVESKNEPVLPGEVAIHTGWRMEESGLRVATWLGSDGEQGVLRLSSDHCGDYAKLDSIKSERDIAFNQMTEELGDWLRGRDVPEWLAEVRSHLHAWKANARLANLYWHWSDNRVDGDDEIIESLNAWRKTDKRKWQNERRLSVRIVRRRKNQFRNFVAILAKRYGVAIVSPIDAKELTENSVPEALERDNTQATRHAKWAAVSELTCMVREKFPLRCVDVDSKNITRQCANCGELNEAPRRKVQCVGCGKVYDRDDNAVVNTLARGEAAIKHGVLLANVAEQEVKAEKRAEKLAKMQEANRVARKAKRDDMELQGVV